MNPPVIDNNTGEPESSQLLSFRPSVLSFSSFTYVGRTVPLKPTGSIGTINPFLGMLLFCQPCGALDHWSKDKHVFLPVSSSEKDDYTLLGNEPGDVDKDHEYTNEECESDNGEDSSSGEEEEWEDESDCVTTSDCETVVEFESSSEPKCPPCLPILSHTFSFSSEESGFCEQLHCEWSEDEENADLPDCDFNEGLWLNFERQACFTGIPLKKEKPRTKCATRPQTQLTIEHSYTSCSSGAKSSSVNTMMCTLKSNCVVFPSVNKHATVDTDKGNTPVTHNHRKRVSFKPDHELVTVHYMVAWKYAYHACRKGPWEQYAADRERFNKRIQTVDSMLTPCLVKTLYHFKF